jgi:murein DD-endopeptidase MepM/ murein hydrolase activator NlpD
MAFPYAPTSALAVTSAEKQAEADEMVRQLDALQSEITQIAYDLEAATAAQDVALRQMQDAKGREDAALARTAQLQDQLGQRARESYRNGTPSYLEVLLGSHSFSELVSTWDMVNRLNEHDAQLTRESKETRKEAESARQVYQEQERIAAGKKEEIADLKASKEKASASMQVEIERLNQEAAELLAQEEAAAEAARLAEEAARLAALALQGSRTGTTVTSEQLGNLPAFTHPCPGGTVSSKFGWRSFDNAFHMGLDLAAPTGTPILAAVGGTVIIADDNPTAGKWVVISHGSGLVTKYMHASELYVSPGQTVSAGETIAAVGNTGNSFGAHLHFQVEINGAAVDPQLLV